MHVIPVNPIGSARALAALLAAVAGAAALTAIVLTTGVARAILAAPLALLAAWATGRAMLTPEPGRSR